MPSAHPSGTTPVEIMVRTAGQDTRETIILETFRPDVELCARLAAQTPHLVCPLTGRSRLLIGLSDEDGRPVATHLVYHHDSWGTCDAAPLPRFVALEPDLVHTIAHAAPAHPDEGRHPADDLGRALNDMLPDPFALGYVEVRYDDFVVPHFGSWHAFHDAISAVLVHASLPGCVANVAFDTGLPDDPERDPARRSREPSLDQAVPHRDERPADTIVENVDDDGAALCRALIEMYRPIAGFARPLTSLRLSGSVRTRYRLGIDAPVASALARAAGASRIEELRRLVELPGRRASS